MMRCHKIIERPIWPPLGSMWAPFELIIKSSESARPFAVWQIHPHPWPPRFIKGETQSNIRSGPLALRRADRPHKQGEIMVFFPFFIPEGLGGLTYIKNPIRPRTPNALPLSRWPDFDRYCDDVWWVKSTYQVLSGSEYNKQHSIGGHAAKFAVWRGPTLKCFTNASCVPELNEFVNEWINELINKQVIT